MVLMKVEYKIKEDRLEEYFKFSNEVSLPFWRTAEGFKEIRGYRDPVRGRTLVLMDFKDFETLGRIMDSDKYKEILRIFSSLTTNAKWELWESSIAPEPIKPM
jgi:hypothetical protein